MAVINVQHARATAVHIISTILLSQAERLFTFADHLGTVAVNGCGPETRYLDASNWGSRTIYRSELHTLCALLQVLCMVLLLYAVGQSCDALMTGSRHVCDEGHKSLHFDQLCQLCV